MNYEGIFCKLKFDESVFSYRLKKGGTFFFFWSKYNKRVEIPINTIIDMRVDQYMPYGRGLVIKIKSGYQYEKVKTLTPMNVTAVPNRVIDELKVRVEKNQKPGAMAASF